MNSNENSIASCIYVHNTESEFLSHHKAKVYDREKALEESRRILDLISTPRASHRSLTGEVKLNTCYLCKVIMPLNLHNQCKFCDEVFCGRHKSELNHQCEKLSKETAKYLNAKNQFKLRLREAKSNAAR